MPEGVELVRIDTYESYLQKPAVNASSPHVKYEVAVENLIVRVGVHGQVVYGLRRDESSGVTFGFIYHVGSGALMKDFPQDELARRLHDTYGIDDPATVSAHLYKFNSDGGPVD